jgi:hypothetical protein
MLTWSARAGGGGGLPLPGEAAGGRGVHAVPRDALRHQAQGAPALRLLLGGTRALVRVEPACSLARSGSATPACTRSGSACTRARPTPCVDARGRSVLPRVSVSTLARLHEGCSGLAVRPSSGSWPEMTASWQPQTLDHSCFLRQNRGGRGGCWQVRSYFTMCWRKSPVNFEELSILREIHRPLRVRILGHVGAVVRAELPILQVRCLWTV